MDDPLAESLRAIERVLDHQLSSFLAGRGDLERLMRLGIAALAGTLAGTGLLLQAGAGFLWFSAIATGLGVVLMAIATAVASGAATPSDLSVGPNPVDLYQSMNEGTPSTRDIRVALVDQAVLAHRHNSRSLERLAARTRIASRVLFTGAGLVLTAMAYVVGGTING